MENNQDESQVLETETTEEATEQTAEETTAEVEVAEDIEAIKAKAAKAEELEAKNRQLFERLKKAEAPKAEAQESLSNKDIIYLAKADIHTDDMDEVLELARLKKWDVSKAHEYLKPVLDTRAEERKTAQATQVRGTRGTSKTSGEDILTKAEKTGEVPESAEGLESLFKARMARRIGN